MEDSESKAYRVYPSRWGVLATVFMFGVSNNLIWITFSAVSTKAADYYGVQVDSIDLLSSISFLVGMPFCIICTYMVSKWGLRQVVPAF